ncbi:S-adenosyl-L-methionine-dependent methyltransferase [Armillaria borealis]|uniref:Protein arginine methyltransferase NDUFAF7 n=1 Tax=Armillaria borealis TaxID=47425 RepID=A0AA39JQG2_9AGAR|nr:S-adenosyl-L-methionine-dependent methyltransferase [Armillaria borealis]
MLSLGAQAVRCIKKHRTPWLSLRYSTSRKQPPTDLPKDKWNYNTSPLFSPIVKDTSQYPIITGTALQAGTTAPRSVKMLARDFIEDSLYNPNYGYFSKQATIFDSKQTPFIFSKLRDSTEFEAEVAKKYAAYEADQQLWHTPTELFKPWYGQAVAQCLVSEYLLKYFPYEDFIIYEIGAGNGTLALNILDYLRDEYPDVYERTRYTIVEISANLAELQKAKLHDVHPCVNVVHKSVFHWDKREPAPCFFMAMEVIDNFAHDVIRYDMETLEPYQGLVVVDDDGDFDMVYTPVSDPLISAFLELRKSLAHPPPISKVFQSSKLLRRIYRRLPFAANLSVEEYIPTRLLSLLRTLRNHFPRHRLLLSDFSHLPETIPGVNSPVVQTRFKNTTIATDTLLVRPGAFDIFFPTDFDRLRDMYEYTLSQPPTLPRPSSDNFLPSRSTPLTAHSLSLSLGADYFSSRRRTGRRTPLDGVTSASGLPVGERKSSVFTHAEFLETYADLLQTRLRNGENPMLDFYKNVKFLF